VGVAALGVVEVVQASQVVVEELEELELDVVQGSQTLVVGVGVGVGLALCVVVHASPATAEPAIKREVATAETFILTLGGWKWWF